MIRTTLSALALATSAAAGIADVAGSHLEVAVYTVHDAGTFPATRAEAARRLAGEPGFRHWVRLASESGLQADVLFWDTSGDAKRAAARMPADPKFAAFVGGIKEMRYFGHLSSPAAPGALAGALDAGPLVEIALYTVRDAPAFDAARDRLYARLAEGRPGPRGTFLVADGDAAGRGDLLVWPDRETWERTGREMMARPDLGAFFGGIGTSIVFDLFHKDTAP